MPDALVFLSLAAVTASAFAWGRKAPAIRSGARMAAPSRVHEVHDAATLDEALGSNRAVLFKHSTRCGFSAVIIEEVFQFAETHPDWTIYVLGVVEHRDLSSTVSRRLGVRHESPQAFVVKAGRCVWHGSHNEISEHSLSDQAT